MDISARPKRDPHLQNLGDPTLFREFAFVNVQWCAGDDRAVIDVTKPADGTRIGAVAALSTAQSLAAVEFADAAFTDWSMHLPQERSAVLRRWFELMLAHAQDLALIMTLEQGKPLSQSLGEIDYAASFVEFYADEAKRPNIESVTSHLSGGEVELWREPVGVAGLTTPWNFPAAMLTRKAGAALASGCTIVAHPSKHTPFSALALAELAERAGMPKGVFNVLTGNASDLISPWMDSPKVRAISFAGSTEVGRHIYIAAARSP